MKKKFIFFTMLLLTLMGGVKFNVLNAQTVEIGDDQNPSASFQYYLPVYESKPYSISQQLYLESDFEGKTGNITSVSFKLGNNRSEMTRQWEVYLQPINSSSFASKTFEPLITATKVYDGNVLMSGIKDDWVTINFTTSFPYSGGNVLLTVYDKSGSALSSQYHTFYAYATLGRTIYKSSDTALDVSSLPEGTNYTKSNQVRFTVEATTPSVKVTPENINLGTVKVGGDYWTEKPFEPQAVNVKAQGGAVISSVETTNSFFTFSEEYTGGDNFDFTVGYNKNGDAGTQTGNIVVAYDETTKEVLMTATAYVPANGDVKEKAITADLTSGSYTHTASGMYDDYILPGETTDGNLNDAVYTFTLENDAVLTASVTGNNPIVAIYNEDFGEKDGPSSDNNYEGVSNEPATPSAPTTFFYDFENGSLEDFEVREYDGNNNNWQLINDASAGGSQCMVSYSYLWSASGGIGQADNYIITKEKYLINENSKLSFDTRILSKQYPDAVMIKVSTDKAEFSLIETISPYSTTYINKTVNLGAKFAEKGLEYGEYYIALHHQNTNYERIFIDNLALTDGSAKSRSVAQTRSTNQIDRMLYPAGTYYLVAAAEGDFTLKLSTEALPAPEAATLTAPVDEATEQNNPLLTWTLDKFAEEYQLLLGTANPPTDVVVNWSAPATSYQTKGLANNTVYYWQVKSKNSVGETSSEVFSFVTPLNKPTNVTASKTNLYPGDETKISWEEADDATSYNVYVGETKVASKVTETSYTLSGLEYNVNPGHNVTVTANHTLGESAKSDAVVVKMTANSTVTFTVKNAAGTPVQGASVRIYNGKDQYGVAIAEQTFTTNADGQVVEDLLYLYGDYTGYYFFEVTKAPYATYNYDSSSEFISSSNFNNPTYAKDITLQLAAPTGLAVESDKLYPGDNLVVTWNGIAEADSYKVYVNGEEHGVANTNEYTIEKEDLEYNVTNNNNNGDFVQVQAVYDGIGESAISSEYKYFKVTGYGSFAATVSVEGATMKLEGTDEFGAPQTYTIDADGNGKYAANEVLAGSYTATASAFGYNDATYNVTVINGKEASCNFDMTEKPTASEELLKDVAVAEYNGEAKVTWTGANDDEQMYNIYRRNVETGDVKLVAEDQNTLYNINDSYTDAVYATSDVEDGKYQYGVTTMVDADEDILNEGFENELPSGWDAPWSNSASWTVSNYSPYAHSGTYSAYVFSRYSYYTANITTAVIDLTQNTSAKLSFYYKNTKGTDYANDFYVKIKKETEANWEELKVTGNTVANYTKYEMSLDEYVGNKIQLSFEVYTYVNAYTHLDDIVITGTKKTETAPVWSNTIKKGGIVFTNAAGDKNWNNTANWSTGEVPANDGTAEVTIKGSAEISSDVNVKYLAISVGAYLTVNKDATLTVTGELANNDVYALTINDGAQVFHNSENVKARFAMDIVAPETWSSENTDGWQFIAAPFVNNTAPIANFTSPNHSTIVYDLYKYNGVNAGAEWDNQKDNPGTWGDYFENGVGYLASYPEKSTAYLSGTLNNASSHTWNFTYNNDEQPLANFHLLGNPFTFDMNMNNAIFTNMVNGVAIVTAEGGYDYEVTSIPVGDGFFVKATGEDPSFSYNVRSRAKRGESFNSLNITATGNAGKDNVVINFAGKSEGFDKLQNFNDAIATVYVAEDGKNYGIYNCDADVQEVALSFNANKMGNYTISIEPNGKFQTVTLVDRFTGIETNMLVEDYNFTAMSEENPNRFVVRFANGQESTDDSHFVYQSGEELILNIQGEVQIVDVLGRVVYNGEANNDINRINVSSFNSGAYMVRVMNGNDVKVEKVVIY